MGKTHTMLLVLQMTELGRLREAINQDVLMSLPSFRVIFSNPLMLTPILSGCTDMQEKAMARLREIAPAARGSQGAGFTQPSLHLFLHVCIACSNHNIISPFLFLAHTFDSKV